MNTELSAGWQKKFSYIILLATCIAAITLYFVPVSAQVTTTAELNAQRLIDFNKKCAGGYELCYEAGSGFGEYGPPHQMWDNPITENWLSEDFRKNVFKFNMNVDGVRFLHIDRSQGKSGPAWYGMRDPDLTWESGFEFRLRLRISPKSDPGGVALLYIDEQTHFGLIFNTDGLVLNPVANQRYWDRRNASSTPMNLTDSFHEFVITRAPSSNLINVFHVESNGSLRPILTNFYASLLPRPADFRPQFSIGGNQDDITLPNGAVRKVRPVFDLDFFRVKRSDASRNRLPPPLPVKDSAATPYKTLLGHGSTTRGEFAIPRKDLNETRGYTIAWKMKFLQPIPDGYHLSVMDNNNAYSVVIEPSTILARTYGKPLAAAVPKIPGFDPMKWNCYQFARQAGGPYGFVYLNGSELPVISDFKGSQGNTKNPFILMGGDTVPDNTSDAWSKKGTLPGLGAYVAPVEIEYVKYADGAYAPYQKGCGDTLLSTTIAPTVSVATLENRVLTPNTLGAVVGKFLLNGDRTDTDLTFDNIVLSYTDNAPVDPGNCVIYHDGKRISGTLVQPEGTGDYTFESSGRKIVMKAHSRTEFEVRCTIPAHATDGSFNWGFSPNKGRVPFMGVTSSGAGVAPYASAYAGQTVHIRKSTKTSMGGNWLIANVATAFTLILESLGL